MPEKDKHNIEQVPVQRSTTQVNIPNYELDLRERAKANVIKEHEELMEQYKNYPTVKTPEWFSLLQETAPEGPISNILLNMTYNNIGKKLYEQKYNEYIEQNPLPKMAGTGYNPYIGIQYNPTVQQQQKAHDYAVKESGYVGDKSTEPYKEIDKAFGEISVAGASMIPLFGASTGTLGVLPKLAADSYFGYEGIKGLTSPEGVAKTVNFVKQGRGGRAVLSGIGDLLDLAFVGQGLKGLRTISKFAKEAPYVARFNWMNRKSGFKMDYPWQRTPETLPERLTLEHIAENQTPKYNPNQLHGLNKQLYQSPSASQLETIPQVAYASNIQKQLYQRPQTNITPIEEAFRSSLNSPDMISFYKGSKPMLYDVKKNIDSDPNFEYFERFPYIEYDRPIKNAGGAGRFYINEDKLKQTIGAYKDLYTSRLNLPNTATVDDIYNHILSNPAKIDPALNKAGDIQDILGLSLGYGIKDAMLFKDPHLLDLDGVYKETVPGIFDILSKRMNLKQLKREHGTFNGNHATWKFRTSALDDWKMKDKPKINLLSLNEDLPRESMPMWKRIGSIIRKAQSDLDAMNSYHIQNVEEWNKLNGKNFKPTTFRTDVGMSKILSKKDFINWIKQKKTNGPSNDVERVGAMYDPYEDMVYLRDDGTSSGAYHDFLHQGQYGMRNPQVTLWRIGQLVDPEKVKSLNPRQAAYYLSEQELPVYLRQMGENANINVGDPYPGDAEFDKLLTEYPIFGSATFLKRDTPEEKRLFWRALNGTLFGLTGVSLIPQKQE